MPSDSPAHAAIGGSASYLWGCPAAYSATRGLPRGEAGLAAEQGTALHSVFELHALGRRAEAQAALAALEIVTDEQRASMAVALEQVDALLEPFRGEGCVVLPEVRLDIAAGLGLPQYGDLCFGTADIVAFDPARGSLLVADLKTGQKFVSADCDQLALYALAAAHAVDAIAPVSEVCTAVVQFGREVDTFWPTRLPNSFDGIKADLAFRLERMLDPAGAQEFDPGEHCTFCPARPTCRAHAEFLLGDDLALLEAEPEKASTLSSEELTRIVAAGPQITSLVKAARAALIDRVAAGEPLGPELKWVRSITRRGWADAGAALGIAELLEVLDVVAPRKLLSPPRVFDLLPERAADFKHLVTKPEGAPTLAPATDRRKPITPAATELAALRDLASSDVAFTDETAEP